MAEQDQRQRDASSARRKPADAAPDEVIGTPHGRHGGSEESEGSPQEPDGGSAAAPRHTDDTHGNQGETQPRRQADRLGG